MGLDWQLVESKQHLFWQTDLSIILLPYILLVEDKIEEGKEH